MLTSTSEAPCIFKAFHRISAYLQLKGQESKSISHILFTIHWFQSGLQIYWTPTYPFVRMISWLMAPLTSNRTGIYSASMELIKSRYYYTFVLNTYDQGSFTENIYLLRLPTIPPFSHRSSDHPWRPWSGQPGGGLAGVRGSI